MKLVMAKEGYRKVGDKWLIAKKCTKCGRWLVASTEIFYKSKRGKYGLRAECKECIGNRNKQYYEANRDSMIDYQKQWYKANRDKKLERQKQYRDNNKEKEAERHKQYYEDHKDKISEYHKQYYQSPQGQVAHFNASNKRRHKKEAQGTGATPEQWREMMEYFDWRCAYTGERLTDKTRSVDHIVAIDTGGDDMIWNMVPMTRSLNSSKWKKDMLEWYKKQPFFSEARLAKIYEWQEYARKKWKK